MKEELVCTVFIDGENVGSAKAASSLVAAKSAMLLLQIDRAVQIKVQYTKQFYHQPVHVIDTYTACVLEDGILSYHSLTTASWFDARVVWRMHITLSSPHGNEIYALLFSDMLNIHCLLPSKNGSSLTLFFYSEKDAYDAKSRVEFLHYVRASEPVEAVIYTGE